MAAAFRASNRALSLWDQARVSDCGDSLDTLCFDQLDGAGQALLLTSDYTDAVADANSPVFDPKVVWRPEDAFVAPAWRKWSSAHIHVEAQHGDTGFPASYRLSLSLRCKPAREPSSQVRRP